MHIPVVVVAVGNGVGAGSEGRQDVALEEREIYNQMLNAQQATVMACAGYLALGVIAAIVESNGQSNSLLLLIEQRGGVETTGIDDGGVLDGGCGLLHVFLFC